MQSNTVLVLAAAVILTLSACAHQRSSERFSACVLGEECIVEGKLNLQAGEPAWAALVENGDSCAKLALPESFYSDAQLWNGKKVRVAGRAFQQPKFDDGGGMVVLWYTEKDRKLALGVCDGGPGIYVESMRSGTGQEWPAK